MKNKYIKHSKISDLLSHTPELYHEAAARDVDLYLCRHTHGGQICFPDGTLLFTNSDCPRNYVSGAWKCQRMKGYTSRGIGISGLLARFLPA